MKLDRSRPYGEIFGGTGLARYEQDGRQFDSGGEVIATDHAPAKVESVQAPEVPTRKKRGSKTHE